MKFGSVTETQQFKRDKGLKDKVVSWLKELAAKLKNALTAYKDVKPDSPEGKMVADMEDFRKDIMGIYTSALVDAGENFRENGGNNNTTWYGREYEFSIRQTQKMTLKEQLSAYYGKKLKRSDSFYFGVTPGILSRSGIDGLPLAFSQDDFSKSTKIKHNIPRRFILNLHKNISDPVFSFTAGKQVAIMTKDIDSDGKPVVVAIHGGHNMDRKPVNLIKSAYGVDSIHKWVSDQINGGGKFRIYDVEKATAMLQTEGYLAEVGADNDGSWDRITRIEPDVNKKFSDRDPTTETQQFKRWFGGSKIVNVDGSPKIMYHGSQAQFDTFDRKKAKSSGTFGKGFYFTDSTSHAGTYGNLYAVYLSIQNPLQHGKGNVTSDQVRKFLEAVAENEDYSIENYGTYDVDQILRNVMSGKSKADAFRVIQDISATAIGDMVEAVELFNHVNGTDYDGIVTAMETVAFQPTQIKSATDNVGTFDKSNPNMYFSDRDPTAEATQAALEKENGKLREDVSRLRELLRLQGKVTGGTVMKQSSIEAAARWLNKYAVSKADVKELSGMLKDFYSFLATDKDYSWEDVRERAMVIARFLQDNVQVKPQISDYARDVLREVRGIKITLDEQQRAEVEHMYGSYEAFRKAALGTVTFVKEGGIPLGRQWQEWSTMFPGTFDSEINSNDQPAALLDAIDALRNSDTTVMEYAYNREGILQDIMRAVYDSYWRVDALVTVADRDQKTMNDLKAKQVEKVQELKGKISDKNARINQLRAEHRAEMDSLKKQQRQTVAELKQKRQEDIKKLRTDYRKKLEDTRSYYQESRKTAVESRKKTIIRLPELAE